MTTSPNPTCLSCGQPLAPISPLTSPPWLCQADSLAFYNAELTPTARLAWRQTYQDFGYYSQVLLVLTAAEQTARRGI